jgi:hypothetical protein
VLGFYGGSVVLHLPELLATWIWIGLGWCFCGEQIRWSYCQRRRGKLQPTLPMMMLFFFGFWAQSIPKLMTPTWPTSKSHLPYFQYMRLSIPKESEVVWKTKHLARKLGDIWGGVGMATHSMPILYFSNLFLYTRDHKPYKSFCLLLSHHEEANSKHNPIKLSLHFKSILSPNAKCI